MISGSQTRSWPMRSCHVHWVRPLFPNRWPWHQRRKNRSPLGRRNNVVVPPPASVIANGGWLVSRVSACGLYRVATAPPPLTPQQTERATAAAHADWVRLLTRYGKLFREVTIRHQVRFSREVIRF